MAAKSVQSTGLRPEGNRILDAPLVEINLKQMLKNIKVEETWFKGDRNAITVYKTDGMKMVLVALRKGAKMGEHKAEGIVSIQILFGAMNFTTAGKTRKLEAGKIAAIHKEMLHSVHAVENCIFLLTIAG